MALLTKACGTWMSATPTLQASRIAFWPNLSPIRPTTTAASDEVTAVTELMAPGQRGQVRLVGV